MLQRNKLGLGLFCALCLSLAPPITSADDFAPPPWSRAHPHAVTAEWEFLAPANPLPPDGPLTNVGTKGSGTAPGGTVASIGPLGAIGWGIGDGDGGWFFPGVGEIRFRVDNVIDIEPVKHIRMQVTHTPGLGLDVDTLPTFNIGATGSAPSPVTTIPFDAIHTVFVWDMFPNPPWEDLRLVVFGGGEIDQIVIDTISIPEPSTLGLSGVGLLAAVQRRRGRA